MTECVHQAERGIIHHWGHSSRKSKQFIALPTLIREKNIFFFFSFFSFTFPHHQFLAFSLPLSSISPSFFHRSCKTIDLSFFFSLFPKLYYFYHSIDSLQSKAFLLHCIISSLSPNAFSFGFHLVRVSLSTHTTRHRTGRISSTTSFSAQTQ